MQSSFPILSIRSGKYIHHMDHSWNHWIHLQAQMVASLDMSKKLFFCALDLLARVPRRCSGPKSTAWHQKSFALFSKQPTNWIMQPPTQVHYTTVISVLGRHSDSWSLSKFLPDSTFQPLGMPQTIHVRLSLMMLEECPTWHSSCNCFNQSSHAISHVLPCNALSPGLLSQSAWLKLT